MIEYKYAIVDNQGKLMVIEEGENRQLDLSNVESNTLYVLSDLWFRYNTGSDSSAHRIFVFMNSHFKHTLQIMITICIYVSPTVVASVRNGAQRVWLYLYSH